MDVSSAPLGHRVFLIWTRLRLDTGCFLIWVGVDRDSAPLGHRGLFP